MNSNSGGRALLRLTAMACGACLVAMVSACSSGPRLGEAGTGRAVSVVQGDVLPPPSRADVFAQSSPYLIGPLDKLKVDVFGVADLSDKDIQADASGRISFPLAGEVQAAGKTTNELARDIESRLRRYVRDPQVTVNIVQTVSQVITVDGEVKAPGIYPVMGDMTLTKAIATAKGLSEYAKLDDVVVFRTVDGKRMAALYNLRAIRAGNYSDPGIYAGDLITIGDSASRRIFRDVLSASSLFTAPLVAILR